MSSIGGSLLTIVVGRAAILSTWTGTYANYVKVGLKWPLIVSGIILIAAGTMSLLYARRRNDTAHGHGMEGVGALLIVFVVALGLAPPPLGAAAAADRVPNRIPTFEATDQIGQPVLAAAAVESSSTTSTTTAPTTTTTGAPVADAPLPEDLGDEVAQTFGEGTIEVDAEPVEAESTEGAEEPETAASEVVDGGPIPILLYDFIGYAYFAPDEIIGVPLELTGFAAEEPDLRNSFRLTRYILGCCAADAYPLQVTLANPQFIPDLDDWVVAQVVWNGELTAIDEYGDGVPVVEVLSIVPIDPPRDPYES